MTLTDEQLAREYTATASDESVGELVRRYLPRVRRIVFPMVLDHQEADDLAQEIMIKTIRGLDRFKGDASVSTWVTRIAMNTTYTFLQRRKRRAAESLPPGAPDRSGDASPVHAAIGKELDDEVQNCLRELTPKLRAAIVLTAIDGMSPGEAAEIEGCSSSAMHSRIHEARKQMRRRLREYVSEESEND